MHNKGSGHWRWQRVSAIMLAPLTLWFMFAVMPRVSDRRFETLEWIAYPPTAIALIIFIAAMMWHAQLGLQVVLEDYVGDARARKKAIVACALINLTAAAAAVIAIACIALR